MIKSSTKWTDSRYSTFSPDTTALAGQGLLIVPASWSHSRQPTLGRTQDEWSARRSDIYLTTYNTNQGHTFMLSAGLEPTTPTSERPQTHALDSATTGIGHTIQYIACATLNH
jgi:hypothetical protein